PDSVSSAPASPANYCYRHPDRQSFVLCQRCGRPICPECQTQAAVGVHCPECVREGRAALPRTARLARALRPGRSIVTYALMGLIVVAFVLQVLTGQRLTSALQLAPW